jgi:hypothetical protein
VLWLFVMTWSLCLTCCCCVLQERLCRALLQYQHPPTQLSSASMAALRAAEDGSLAARVGTWREALRSAYSSLRHGHCPALYISGQVGAAEALRGRCLAAYNSLEELSIPSILGALNSSHTAAAVVLCSWCMHEIRHLSAAGSTRGRSGRTRCMWIGGSIQSSGPLTAQKLAQRC